MDNHYVICSHADTVSIPAELMTRFDENYRAIPHYYLELALAALSENKPNRPVSQNVLELKNLFSNSSTHDKKALDVALDTNGADGLKKVFSVSVYFLVLIITFCLLSFSQLLLLLYNNHDEISFDMNSIWSAPLRTSCETSSGVDCPDLGKYTLYLQVRQLCSIQTLFTVAQLGVQINPIIIEPKKVTLFSFIQVPQNEFPKWFVEQEQQDPSIKGAIASESLTGGQLGGPNNYKIGPVAILSETMLRAYKKLTSNRNVPFGVVRTIFSNLIYIEHDMTALFCAFYTVSTNVREFCGSVFGIGG